MDISLRQTVGCISVKPPLTATSLQWPLFSVPKVAIVELFTKNFALLLWLVRSDANTHSISKANISFDPSSLLYFVDPQRRRKLLFEKLHVLAEQDNGLRSIITSLLLTPDDCQSGQQAKDVMQFLLDWLLGMNILEIKKNHIISRTF